MPAGHSKHTLALLAPLTLAKVPALQSIQVEAPTTGLYVPISQSIHTVDEVTLEKRPAEQSGQAVNPERGPLEPAGHSVHADAPTKAENLP